MEECTLDRGKGEQLEDWWAGSERMQGEVRPVKFDVWVAGNRQHSNGRDNESKSIERSWKTFESDGGGIQERATREEDLWTKDRRYQDGRSVWHAADGGSFFGDAGKTSYEYIDHLITNYYLIFVYIYFLMTENKVTGNCLKTIEGHTDCVTSVHFDGRGLLASGSEDGSIRLWEVTTGNCLKTLEGHTRCVTSVHIDGRGLLASGSADRSIRLWEVTTGNCLKTLEGHTHCVTSVHFDGRGLLASETSGRLYQVYGVLNTQWALWMP